MGLSGGKNWEMKNWQRGQVPRKWRENGGDEERNCDCIKSDRKSRRRMDR